MKKKVLAVLGLFLAFCMLATAMFALVGCGDKDDADEEEDGGSRSGEDGTYFYYADGKYDRTVFIRLSGGKWMMNDVGETMSGTYGISGGGKITFKYTISGSDELGRMIMDELGKKEGQSIELCTGKVGDGVLLLETAVEGALPLHETFCQEGKTPKDENAAGNTGNAGSTGSGKIDGTYYCAENGETVVLSDGRWILYEDGEEYASGTYTLDGNQISLVAVFLGEAIEAGTGTWSGNTITVDEAVYIRQ